MRFKIVSNTEILDGAVLVTSGQHIGRTGYYCLQNEQTFDMSKLADCAECKLTVETMAWSATNTDPPIEIESGTYCLDHRRELIEGDMASNLLG